MTDTDIKIISDLYQLGLGIKAISDLTGIKIREVSNYISTYRVKKYSKKYSKNLEFILDFIKLKKESPIIYQDESIVMIKRYLRKTIQSTLTSKEYTYVESNINPKYIVIPKIKQQAAFKLIAENTLVLEFNLDKFINLKKIKNEIISPIKVNNKNYQDIYIIPEVEFKKYLDNLKNQKLINSKIGEIIRDKFRKQESDIKPTTSAIFKNLGYIVRDLEEKYIEISKEDKSFLKKFFYTRINAGDFQIKITESLPLYKESIKEIIFIGRELMKQMKDQTALRAFSKKYLGSVRSELESCWQLYFEKYLSMFFMSYQYFDSKQSFKAAPGYEQDTIPDFLAIDLYNNIDIIEIKHHHTNLFAWDKNRDSIYPHNELTKSIYQLNKYLDSDFDLIKTDSIKDERVKSLIKNKRIYRPKGILIVSSLDTMIDKYEDLSQERLQRELRKLKSTYLNIEIVLFDELLDSLEKYIQKIEITFKE